MKCLADWNREGSLGGLSWSGGERETGRIVGEKEEEEEEEEGEDPSLLAISEEHHPIDDEAKLEPIQIEEPEVVQDEIPIIADDEIEAAHKDEVEHTTTTDA